MKKTVILLAMSLFLIKTAKTQQDSIIHPLFISIETGTFTDGRDGHEYKWVRIGEHIWMAENLNVGTRIDASQPMENNSKIEKYCYDNLESNCDIYGGLYQWAEAVQYMNNATNETSYYPAPTGSVSGICPAGWHVPSTEEWIELVLFVNNFYHDSRPEVHMKEGGNLHWTKGLTINETGFTALPGGCSKAKSKFDGITSYGSWWTSTEVGKRMFSGGTEKGAIAKSADSENMYSGGLSDWPSIYTLPKTRGMSVRCIKND